MSSSSSSEDENERRIPEHRVAKKSTTQPPVPTKHYQTRKWIRSANPVKALAKDRFLENFNPETSAREKRKLSRKFNPPSTVRRPPGALYDEYGVHVSSVTDMCDCLADDCIGCFFPCPKCGSQKCGIDCRVHRKFVYDQIEYHGYDIVVKNPLFRA